MRSYVNFNPSLSLSLCHPGVSSALCSHSKQHGTLPRFCQLLTTYLLNLSAMRLQNKDSPGNKRTILTDLRADQIGN